jgi:hypothetical protein
MLTAPRLKWMFLFLRYGNLVWLLFSAVTVEVTLNFNHVNGVLGGRHDGGQLQLPSQLLPFLIGLFTFLRTLYFLAKQEFESKEKKAVKEKDEGNKKPDDEGQVIVSPMHFSPSKMEFGFNGGQPDLPRADSYHIVARSLLVRLLVGWLPWLGLVVHPDTKLKSRLSGLVERGTGLAAVSPRTTGLAADQQYHQQFQQWSAETQTPGQGTPVAIPVQFVQAGQPGHYTPPMNSGVFAHPEQYSPTGQPGHFTPPTAPAQFVPHAGPYAQPGSPGQYRAPNGHTQ